MQPFAMKKQVKARKTGVKRSEFNVFLLNLQQISGKQESACPIQKPTIK